MFSPTFAPQNAQRAYALAGAPSAAMETTHWMHSCSRAEYDDQYSQYLVQRMDSEALEASYHEQLSSMLSPPNGLGAPMGAAPFFLSAHGDSAMEDVQEALPLTPLQQHNSQLGLAGSGELRKRSFGGPPSAENAQLDPAGSKRPRLHGNWR